jgi:hypothetical protein
MLSGENLASTTTRWDLAGYCRPHFKGLNIEQIGGLVLAKARHTGEGR